MGTIKLGYDPKQKYNWKELTKESGDYNKDYYNKRLVVTINRKLWGKVQSIMDVRNKGYDSLFLIDGLKRSGKSTLAKIIAYLLDPFLTIDNYVSGLEEASEKIDKAKEESVLIFDEGSLIANSKDAMRKKNVQLLKIIDVVGQKRLTLIFCMPSFFEISRTIAINHSRFLIHIYTDNKLKRGFFAYFSTKKKKMLYEIGKKNFNSYSRPPSSFTGLFPDFHLSFEEEYLKLKKESLKEALNPDYKKPEAISPSIVSKLKAEFMIEFKEACPEVHDKIIAKGFGISERSLYRMRKQQST